MSERPRKRKRTPPTRRNPQPRDFAKGKQLLRGLVIVREFCTHGRRNIPQLAARLPDVTARTVRRDVYVLVRLGWVERITEGTEKPTYRLCDSELLQILGWRDPAELEPPAGTAGGPPAVVDPATDPKSEMEERAMALATWIVGQALDLEQLRAAIHRAAANAGAYARDQRPDLVAAVSEKTRCAGNRCDLATPTGITCPWDSCDLETGIRTNRCAEVRPERENTTEKEPNP